MSKPAYPFSDIKDERLYRFHKLYAESYVTNARNLEAPWKPVIHSVLEAVVQLARVEIGPSIDIAVQQEQPLAPPSLAAASVGAESTMTGSKHKGTVHPDVSVLQYLVDNNINFRTLTRTHMDHGAVDYLICAELKRSITRGLVMQGLTSKDAGYKAVSKSLRKAAFQAAKQAFIAVKRPADTNGDIILFAAVGPFWMWCLPTRNQLIRHFPNKEVEDVLDAIQVQRDADTFEEQVSDPETDDGSIALPSSLHSPMKRADVFTKTDYVLPWSDVVVLDTKESETQLHYLFQALISVLRK